MNKQYISEAFDQLNQMQNSRKRLTESNSSLRIKFKGETISLRSARYLIQHMLPEDIKDLRKLENFSDEEWEQYRQKVIRNGWKISPDRNDRIQQVQNQIAELKEIEKRFLDQAEIKYGERFSSLDEIPEGYGRGRRKAFDGTITSFKQLEKTHSDDVESFKLGKSLLYDYYDPSSYGTWDEQPVKGINSEEDFLSLFKLRNGALYLPKGTTLEYVGHDDYYDWFRVDGTDKEIGFISDYAMYD